MAIVIIILSVIRLLMELTQLYSHGVIDYIISFTNVLEWFRGQYESTLV